jgi:3,4-dihydroxy 2-butanone 4-phosphate synthase/GTP cyclohydrolase II
VDLARLAGLYPAGILCEVTNEDGEMARLPDLKKLAREMDLKILTINDLIDYRRRTERLITKELETALPTRFGDFRLHLFRDVVDQGYHIALTVGDVSNGDPVLTRIHSQCFTGDVFSSLRCDCGTQLEESLVSIQREGRGALVYLHQEGRGIGLVNKLKAYALQDDGLDTVEANLKLGFQADEREYSMAAQVLTDLGVSSCRLLTNNPHKESDLERYGVSVAERISIASEPTDSNRRYLTAKREKLGHFLDLGELTSPNGSPS